MDACLHNDTRIGNYTFADFEGAYNRNLACGDPTYIRPNIGGSLYPWIYLTPLLFIHGPVLWERIYHWEKVQAIAIALAAYTIITIAMGYLSTRWDPTQVLVWMPLTALLDCGAMMQLYFLIRDLDKDHSIWRTIGDSLPSWLVRNPRHPEPPLQGEELNHLNPAGGRADQAEQARRTRQVEERRVSRESRGSTESRRPREPRRSESITAAEERGKAERTKRAWIALAALVALLILFALQALGLAFAIIGLRKKDLEASWCSPLLENLVVGVLDSVVDNTTTNCPNFYDITIDSNKGIGCVKIDGRWQKDWLLITAIILPLSLACEIFDLITLLFAPAHSERVNGMDMRRPWATMFFGITMFLVLMVVSAYHSMHLPDGLSKSMWIFRYDPSSESFGACVGLLHPAGLRGSILAWTDGLLGFMNWVYLGR